MYEGIKPGVSIKAKYTQTNKSCLLDPDNAKSGFVCKADDAGISIYIDKGLGKGYIEARMTPATFAANFEIDGRLLSPATAYIRSSHYSRVFPDDFL